VFFSVNWSGRVRGPSSSQASRIETGAPARDRVENAETDVLVRLFRK